MSTENLTETKAVEPKQKHNQPLKQNKQTPTCSTPYQIQQQKQSQRKK